MGQPVEVIGVSVGLFDVFRRKTWEEENAYEGDTPPCPRCGTSLTKRYEFSEMYCDNCKYGLDDDEHDDQSDESLSVYEAASIWASNGKDDDYTFGYSEAELDAALGS
ncbi:hypothetical protein D4R08_00235 [Corynebacterium xerosis]|nr:hypothetical protein D4R08_00235 [Corynebacterium xerosis]